MPKSKIKVDDSEKLLNILSVFIYQMISNGAQVSQVNRQVKSISEILDVDLNYSISLTSAIISIAGTDKSEVVAIENSSFNLQKVDELTLVTSDLLQNKISLQTYFQKISTIEKEQLDFPLSIRLLGAGLVSLPASLLAQSNWTTYLVAFIIGPLGYLLTDRVGADIDLPYVDSFFGAMSITFLACITHVLFPSVPIQVLVICAIMPLVPGTAIVNSIYEIVHNDLQSGLIRLTQALLAAGSLAIGTIGAVTIFNLFVGIIK